MTDKLKLLLICTGLTVGLFFSVFAFLTPLPLVYLALKQGRKAAVLASLYGLTVVAVVYFDGIDFFGNLYTQYPRLSWILPIPGLEFAASLSPIFVSSLGLALFLFYAASAHVVTAIHEKPEKTFVIALSTLTAALVIALVFYSVVIVPNIETITGELKDVVSQGMDEFLAMEQSATFDKVALLSIKDNPSDLIKQMLGFIPLLFMTSLTMTYLVNLMLSKRLFQGFFPRLAQYTLTQFRVPFTFVWTIIATLSVFLINRELLQSDIVDFLSLNLLGFLGLLYLLQGLAIFIHFLNAKGIFGFFRLVIYFIVFQFLPNAMMLITALGFFDSWMDIRKIEKPALKT